MNNVAATFGIERPGVARLGSLAVSADVTPVLDDIVHSSRLLQDYLSLERGSPQDSQGLTSSSSATAQASATCSTGKYTSCAGHPKEQIRLSRWLTVWV